MLHHTKRQVFILFLFCISGYIFCQENIAAYPSDKIKKSFDLDKYQKFDLLDYLSIESGVAYLHEKKVGADIAYIEMFLFSSMGKIFYHVYRENEIWIVLKDEYTYKEPYSTKDQIMTRIVFNVAGQNVFYIKKNGGNEKVDVTDSKSINRIINAANEIINE